MDYFHPVYVGCPPGSTMMAPSQSAMRSSRRASMTQGWTWMSKDTRLLLYDLKTSLRSCLQELFSRFDKDGSGTVSIDEFLYSIRVKEEHNQLIQLMKWPEILFLCLN